MICTGEVLCHAVGEITRIDAGHRFGGHRAPTFKGRTRFALLKMLRPGVVPGGGQAQWQDNHLHPDGDHHRGAP
jgi:hypothetical protein